MGRATFFLWWRCLQLCLQSKFLSPPPASVDAKRAHCLIVISCNIKGAGDHADHHLLCMLRIDHFTVLSPSISDDILTPLIKVAPSLQAQGAVISQPCFIAPAAGMNFGGVLLLTTVGCAIATARPLEITVTGVSARPGSHITPICCGEARHVHVSSFALAADLRPCSTVRPRDDCWCSVSKRQS
jgi:hypothetical protein